MIRTGRGLNVINPVAESIGATWLVGAGTVCVIVVAIAGSTGSLWQGKRYFSLKMQSTN